MDCLFETSIKYTMEEYKKFNFALIKKRHYILVSIIAVVMIIASGILLHNYFLIFFGIIYPVLFYVAMQMGVKRVFNSNKLMQNMEVFYEFYEEYLVEKHDGGEAKVPYEKLSEVIETKTNFYLMIARNQGFMLTKENMPEGLAEFIRSKNRSN